MGPAYRKARCRVEAYCAFPCCRSGIGYLSTAGTWRLPSRQSLRFSATLVPATCAMIVGASQTAERSSFYITVDVRVCFSGNGKMGSGEGVCVVLDDKSDISSVSFFSLAKAEKNEKVLTGVLLSRLAEQVSVLDVAGPELP